MDNRADKESMEEPTKCTHDCSDATINASAHLEMDASASTTLLRTATQSKGDEIATSKVSSEPKSRVFQASFESSVMFDNGCGVITEKPNSHCGKTHQKIETLDRIAKKLREYVPRDELDQDAIASVISKMNMDAFRRHRRRDMLRNCNSSIVRSPANNDHECYWNDDDIIQRNKLNLNYSPCTKHFENLINVVSETFFDSIIDKVEDSDDSLDYINILDDDTIKNLKDSLAIQRNLNNNRKRRTLRVAVSLQSTGKKSKPYDIIKLSNVNKDEKDVKKRVTRGMTRDTNITENKNEGLEALLAAMIELEMAAGKPVNILGDIATPNRLRNRKKMKRSPSHYVQNGTSKNSMANSASKVSENETPKLIAHIEKFCDRKQQGSRKRAMYQVEVNKIIVGGKEFKKSRKLTNRKRKVDMVKKKPQINKTDLNLLEWSSKNLPLKSNHLSKRALPTNSTKSIKRTHHKNELSPKAIDAILTSWNAIGSLNSAPDVPASMEPSRKRHKNEKYGSMCSVLVNCLQGSARVFARHEFFYSDIDKSWFNENPFHKDLIGRGIDPSSKMTRREWSAIRRKIRKPPRRFTRAFIDDEFRNLNKYRKIVRKIQWAIHRTNNQPDLKEPFEYEVFAPPQVGTICTAYHHKTHLLHRGIVLAHDHHTEAYLVQFEKKALGYEWCADFEVSSHGLPRIIYPSTNKTPAQSEPTPIFSSCGTIPSGTCYDSLIEFYNKETKGLNRPIYLPPISRKIHLKKEIDLMIEMVTEREALVKLMCIIEIAFKQKESIIEALAVCNANYKRAKDTNEDTTLLPNYAQFKKHYSCLFKKLKLNEKTLEAAVAQLQIIYGFSMSSRNEIDEQRIKKTDHGGIWTLDKPHLSRHRCMDQQLLEISESIASKVSPHDDASATEQYLKWTLSSAGGLLLTSNLIMNPINGIIKENQEEKTCIQNSVETALMNQTNLLEPPPMEGSQELTEILRIRESSFDALMESIQLFSAEVSLKE